MKIEFTASQIASLNRFITSQFVNAIKFDINLDTDGIDYIEDMVDVMRTVRNANKILPRNEKVNS